MKKIAILGAGMAGFGAAHRLYNEGLRPILYEKKHYHGGNSASYNFNDEFIFDRGPHISFTKDKRIQELFARSVHQRYEIIKTGVNNYWKGYWIKHPAQCNLYGLPQGLIDTIINDFRNVRDCSSGRINNYEDWLIASYGKTFAETFPMEYGLKFHTTTADNMTTEWIGPRMYRPNLEEIICGAQSPTTSDVHYVDYFRYPSDNGFVSYLDLFRNQTELQLGYCLMSLDPKDKKLHFANGAVVPYEHVISSIPLPDLIPMIIGVPADIVRAAQKLACTRCVVVNIGLNREDISQAHWSYFYDREFFFTRVSFPHMLSVNNVPTGAGSIQAEVYFSDKYRPLDRSPEECIEPVISDLRRCGLVRDDDEIIFSNAMLIPHANIIFDLDRSKALSTAHGYLDDVGIFYCGRYGEWGYLWTDESFMSGEKVAQKILDR